MSGELLPVSVRVFLEGLVCESMDEQRMCTLNVGHYHVIGWGPRAVRRAKQQLLSFFWSWEIDPWPLE